MVHTHGTHVKGTLAKSPVKSSGRQGNRRVAQGVETRAALIDIGRELFGRQGFAETSIEEITAAGGVTKGAFYHHFSGKEDLFREVFEQVERQVTEAIAPSFLEPEPWASLLSGCLATIDAHLEPDVQRISLFDARAVLGWETAREIESRYGAVILRGALRRSMHAGVIERVPLAPLAQMLHGALTEACLVIAGAPDPQVARADVGEVVERILDGLRPRATEP
jgi:AcrR family transcriptional regulator